MYFRPSRTLDWCRHVHAMAMSEPALESGRVRLVVLPAFTSIGDTVRLLAGTPVAVGGQDLAAQDSGAFTGEVSGADLAEIGCTYVEVGHAERRRLFGETDEVVAAKLAAARRHGLTPILCVGETDAAATPSRAAVIVAHQVRSALGTADPSASDVVLAYEPVWAIGQAKPADPAYVAEVCYEVRAELAHVDLPYRLVYGGSAGPGLLTRLRSGGQPTVDGLFLGRFAHDPQALGVVVRELDQATS